MSIGANIGLGALYFLNRYPDARLTSVEPNPEAFRLLEINLASTRFPQASIRLDRRAVAAEDGEVEFVIPKKNKTAVFASVNGIRTSGLEVDTLNVPCVALNRLISEKVDLLKLDIEGFEYEVLDQAEINAQKVSSLIIEFHDREKNGQKCAAILNRLVNEQGYRLSDAHGKSIDVRTFCQGPGAALAKLTA